MQTLGTDKSRCCLPFVTPTVLEVSLLMEDEILTLLAATSHL